MYTTIPFLLLAAILAAFPGQTHMSDKERADAGLRQIRSAKAIYFDDQTRSAAAVGEKARAELKKWGRYKLVEDPTQADLILLFSLNKYTGGYEVHPGGPTNIHGQSQEDLAPSYGRNAPVRAGFLTAIDPSTGDALWSESHQWGGLLTGYNSVGVYLVNKFKKQVK